MAVVAATEAIAKNDRRLGLVIILHLPAEGRRSASWAAVYCILGVNRIAPPC